MTVFTFARKLLEIQKKEKNMRYLIYLFILTSGSLYAGNILKWVDEDGNVYYGDAPPLSVKTEPVRVISAPRNPGKALPRLSDGDSQNDSNAEGTNVAAGDEGAPKLPDDQAKIACQEATDDLRVIKSSSRIRLKSADGTTRYMTTEEINTRRENAEKAIALHCS